jgi:hypothetical protein
MPTTLDIDTGKSADATPTTDLLAVSLYRSLAQWIGERGAALSAVTLLRKAQDASGAWPFALQRESGKPLELRLSPLVGLWATSDLSVPLL